MLHNLHGIPAEYTDKMRENAIHEIARLTSTGDGFYIPSSDRIIKLADEPGSFTRKEAIQEFGSQIITTSLIRGIFNEVDKLVDLRKQVEHFIPRSAFPIDEDIMSFLGLAGEDHLLRPDWIGRHRYLHTCCPGGFVLLDHRKLIDTTRSKVRLFHPESM